MKRLRSIPLLALLGVVSCTGSLTLARDYFSDPATLSFDPALTGYYTFRHDNEKGLLCILADGRNGYRVYAFNLENASTGAVLVYSAVARKIDDRCLFRLAATERPAERYYLLLRRTDQTPALALRPILLTSKTGELEKAIERHELGGSLVARRDAGGPFTEVLVDADWEAFAGFIRKTYPAAEGDETSAIRLDRFDPATDHCTIPAP